MELLSKRRSLIEEMRKFSLLPVLVLVGIATLGCSGRPTLAGSKWTGEVMGGVSTFDFSDDGSVRMDLEFSMIGKLPSSGTFSETEKAVSITLNNIDLPQNPFGKEAERMVERVIGRPISFNLEWKSPDEVELVPLTPAGPFGQKMVLKRKKQ